MPAAPDNDERAAAAAILGDETAAAQPDGLICPDCGAGPFASQAALNGHLAAHRGKQAKSRAQASRERRPTPPKPEPGKVAGLSGEARTIVNKAVGNAQTMGAFLSMVAPHTGLAIAGYRDERGNVIVRSRAEIAGGIFLGHIASASTADELQRAARMLELLRRFNSIFEYTEIGDLAGSLAVAAAVDVRMIPPDFKVKFGQLEIPVVAATIGDVVAELDRQGAYAAAPPNPEDGGGPPADGAETVEGGVEAT